MSTVTKTIPLEVPQAFIDNNGIEVVAIYAMGYQTQVKSLDLDENGHPIMVDNPESAEEYIIRLTREDFKAKAKSAFIAKAKQEAQEQATIAVNSLLG